MSRRLRVLLLITLSACAAACASGCGTAAQPAPLAPSPPATLPPGAVPYLPSALKPLTPSGLAREAGAPQLSSELRAWGYLAGADRYFQGESRQLQVVDSRTLRFKDPVGATKFVAFMRVHANTYLGSFPLMRSFQSRGRRGILAIAQECQCHLANPAYLAVLARDRIVTWLEINGPGATTRRLAELIAAAP